MTERRRRKGEHGPEIEADRPPDIEVGAVVHAKEMRSKKEGESNVERPYRRRWHKGEWVEVRVDPAVEEALSEEDPERESGKP